MARKGLESALDPLFRLIIIYVIIAYVVCMLIVLALIALVIAGVAFLIFIAARRIVEWLNRPSATIAAGDAALAKLLLTLPTPNGDTQFESSLAFGFCGNSTHETTSQNAVDSHLMDQSPNGELSREVIDVTCQSPSPRQLNSVVPPDRLLVRCPNCRKGYSVKPRRAGRRGRCSSCGRVVQIPHAS